MANNDPKSEFILEDFLPYRLSLLSNTVSQGISNAYRGAHGLSVTEWRVIAIIGRFPGLTASEVTARGAMDKVAVSRAVKKLQEKGLVDRSEHAEDRRRLPLKLSSRRGMALFREVVPKALDYERRLLSSLSGDELKRFSRMVGKLQSAANRLSRELEQPPHDGH
jgi:DNA-binding MarR family transcriptional regulator